MLKSIRLDHIREFYRSAYRLEYSVLVLKGDFRKPPLVLGHIEHTFGSFKPKKHATPVSRIPKINSERKIFVFHTESTDPPLLYWYEAVPIENNDDLFQPLIYNTILFDNLTGRIYTNRRSVGLGSFKTKKFLLNHYGVSVINNTVRLPYGNIEKFITLAVRERQKLRSRPVTRQEYAGVWSSIYSQLKVRTQDFRTEVNNGIMNIEYSTSDIIHAGFNRETGKSGSEVVVIVGNKKLINRNLKKFKYQLIDFKLNR
jgi:hypothetical protein